MMTTSSPRLRIATVLTARAMPSRLSVSSICPSVRMLKIAAMMMTASASPPMRAMLARTPRSRSARATARLGAVDHSRPRCSSVLHEVEISSFTRAPGLRERAPGGPSTRAAMGVARYQPPPTSFSCSASVASRFSFVTTVSSWVFGRTTLLAK